jgi:tetratricopeptide (TPR) repeat protein
VYGWDACAWALFRSGRVREAANAARHALAFGTQDPLLQSHAGMIFDAAGEAEQARIFLGRALATNPHFHVFLGPEARARWSRLTAMSSSTSDKAS